ncbi:MAG: histidine kinase [Lachnospiraceae bacterium]|nr:histidine kinase [Lachnospiraceae bacterium]
MERYLLTLDESCMDTGALIWSSTDRQFYSALRESTNRRGQIKIFQKQAQYLALQNQINPHFLYNTLDCIRSEAVIQGIDVIADMTESLSTYFRYTISDLDKLARVSAELENVRNYYTIRHYRFGDRLSLKIDMGEDTVIIPRLYMPKLTLQPIVENAIFHGIERKVGPGEVIIQLTLTQRRLIIKVSDNGVGMSEEALVALNDKLTQNADTVEREKGGIAIANVNKRIKLLFGEEYGIYIRSAPDAGIDVYVTLPIVQTQDEV